jgi:hypothetical protein
MSSIFEHVNNKFKQKYTKVNEENSLDKFAGDKDHYGNSSFFPKEIFMKIKKEAESIPGTKIFINSNFNDIQFISTEWIKKPNYYNGRLDILKELTKEQITGIANIMAKYLPDYTLLKSESSDTTLNYRNRKETAKAKKMASESK